MRIVLLMTDDHWTDEAADAAARAGKRREAGGTNMPAGETRTPADVAGAAPEPLERDSPILYGEDPGTIGQ